MQKYLDISTILTGLSVLALIGVAFLGYSLLPAPPANALSAIVAAQKQEQQDLVGKILSGSSVFRANDALEASAHAKKLEAQEFTKGLRYSLCIKHHLLVSASGRLVQTEDCGSVSFQ